ncbi:MAG: helix-turn-helix domain-containing protein [Bifidobacterium tibiigranuli]|uniref:helix-turn-helix domain-containing protein n=1 Tax=Bifidobacterium tibiigranuli TaxID=2172043 RepID=UPI0026EEE312|nr:helix-turn-helix domain-containing protein [Bifidobacterium tibiigranuli]MCI1673169.1 helix-turn-helix domain-containing protein [Bifidobacterium tibiigranuli]MCI1713586.1 helix-turn-helix domain-containing protein [Bifidobacterium tibiigranuli]
MRDAPVGKDCAARVILYALADHEDPRGRGAYPSVRTLAELSHLSMRTVQRKLDELEEMGIIRRGDQRLVSHIRADRRPVVRDLSMSKSDRGAIPAPQRCEAAADARIEEDRGADSAHQPLDDNMTPRFTTERDDNMTPRFTTERDDNMTPRDDSRSDRNESTGCQKQRHGVTPMSPNTKDKPTNKPRESRAQENSRSALAGFQPDDQHRALAAILNLDLEAERDKFIDSCLANGKMPRDIPAAFRNWLRRGHELGITRQQTHVDAPQRHVTAPHRHSPGCEHVETLIQPYKGLLSTRNADGFGTSPMLKARQALAESLNHGMSGDEALKALRLPVDDLEAIA